MLAGHDTTSNTISWTLLQLAQQPDVQTKLREEIREARRRLGGSGEFTAKDLDGIKYLQAVVKVRGPSHSHCIVN